ncbi:MAG: isochorismate synthase MenF [Desertimonas sp.]
MRAVTRPIDLAPDLTDVARGDGVLFVRDGVGLAGRGAVATVSPDDAVALLASIDHVVESDNPAPHGAGPVAVGWIPYQPGATGELVVPSVTVTVGDDGRSWLTTLDDGHPDELVPPPAPAPTTGSFTIEPVTPVDRYLAAVERVRDAVRDGALTKAVIAREIAVTSLDPIDVHGVLRRLEASFGSSYRFAVDGFIGASPELLVAVEDRTVRSYPLAGTAPRTGDIERDRRIAHELLTSTKDQVEHRVVIDVIHDTLLPWCSYLDWEPEPQVITVANVQHLGTQMEGQLSTPRPSVIELVRALTPTPALGGHPRDAALTMIAEVEGVDRGRYGGAVGWVDAAGNGTWAVAIRAALLSPDRRRARLWAGGGIVADSDPASELAETQAKFQAMLSALVRP